MHSLSKAGRLRLVSLGVLAGCSLAAVAAGAASTKTTKATSRATPTKLADALRLVSDTPEHRRWVVLTDHAAVRRAAGATKLVDALSAMIRRRVQIPAPLQIETAPQQHIANLALIGIDLDVITASVQAGQPPDVTDAIVAPIEKKTVAGRIGTCGDRCAAVPTTSDVGRATLFAYSDDPAKVDIAKRLRPPVFDNLGRGPILTVGDGYLARSYSTASAEGVANARAGRSSLANVPDFRDATRSLEQMGVMAALLINEPLIQSPNVTDPTGSTTVQSAAKGAFLRPYTLLAVGSGLDAAGPFLGVAIVNPTAAMAKENAELLRVHLSTGVDPLTSRPWPDLLSISDIRASGRLTVGTFRGPASGLFMNVVSGRGFAPVG